MSDRTAHGTLPPPSGPTVPAWSAGATAPAGAPGWGSTGTAWSRGAEPAGHAGPAVGKRSRGELPLLALSHATAAAGRGGHHRPGRRRLARFQHGAGGPHRAWFVTASATGQPECRTLAAGRLHGHRPRPERSRKPPHRPPSAALPGQPTRNPDMGGLARRSCPTGAAGRRSRSTSCPAAVSGRSVRLLWRFRPTGDAYMAVRGRPAA